VGKYYPPVRGGIETFLKDLLAALKKEGVDCGAVVHEPSSLSASDIKREEVNLWKAASFGEVLYTPISPGFPAALTRALASFSPHIIHFHLPNVSAFWCLAMPLARNVPWVIQWQSDVVPSSIDNRLRLAYRFYRPFEQALIGRSRAVIASSKPYLDASLPLRRWIKKCHVVPLGLNPDRLPRPGQDVISDGERSWKGKESLRVLAVGRLTYYKGFDVLLKAVKGLKRVAVQIVGDGALRKDLTEKIRALNLEDRVSLRGEVCDEELQGLFATAHCLCLPSIERTEAFGIVLLEAMHYGLRVAASDIPGSGVGWVVKSSGSGFLFQPGDPSSLAETLELISRLPAGKNINQENVDTCIPPQFNIASVAKQVLGIYEGILDG
jgi:rhamnosyl/mannosyltransferase